MNGNQPTEELSRAFVIRTLHELIEALDRRVPQATRPGEIAIAKDSSLLRDEAVAQIGDLRRAAAAV